MELNTTLEKSEKHVRDHIIFNNKYFENELFGKNCIIKKKRLVEMKILKERKYF